MTAVPAPRLRLRTHGTAAASASAAVPSGRVGVQPAPVATPVRLHVVPRRRRAAGFAVTLSVLVAAVMLAAAVLHTRLAERQLEIDRLERGVTAAQERFDVLRRQRAELRSPTRLATEAARLGMQPASASEFMAVDPWILATAIASSGRVPTDGEEIAALEPLDQFRLVKSVTVVEAETP